MSDNEEKMKIPSQWTFKDRSVADGFDRHVREQLPWYDMATKMVAHYGRHYIPQGGTFYDVGASTGNIGNALRDVITSRKVHFHPIDNSPEMAERYAGPGTINIANALGFDFKAYDFATVFLCMMFMPRAERKQWLHELVGKCRRGGAVIVFDKCEPYSGYLGVATMRLTLAAKLDAGVPANEVMEKELSLAGVQRPVSFQADLFPGFREIFRFGDFAGWIYTKDD